MGLPTPPLPGFASHQSTPFAFVSAATPPGSAVINAPPAPIFTKSRRPRAESRTAVSDSLIAISPPEINRLTRSQFIFVTESISIQSFRRTVFLVPVHGLARRVHRDGAQLGKVIEGFDAGLAAHAAVLEAAPRRSGVKPVMVIHPNHSEEELARHAMSSRDIASPDRSGQAKSRVIGNANRVGFVFERQDDGHRPKHFLLRNLRSSVHVVEHGRLNKKSSRQAGG